MKRVIVLLEVFAGSNYVVGEQKIESPRCASEELCIRVFYWCVGHWYPQAGAGDGAVLNCVSLAD